VHTVFVCARTGAASRTPDVTLASSSMTCGRTINPGPPSEDCRNRAGAAAWRRRKPDLTQETRAAFMKAVEQLKAAGATVIIDKEILPESFFVVVRSVNTRPYRREGVDNFLRDFGPPQYHSTAEYEKATGDKFPAYMIGGTRTDDHVMPQRLLETDSEAEANYYGPQRKALEQYEAARKRWKLDGFVYPALQIPTYDETVPGASKAGPYSETGWVNRIGVPAISMPGGFYANGLPFGLEISGVRWKDGELLGYGYAYEQATHNRRLPKLVEGAKKTNTHAVQAVR